MQKFTICTIARPRLAVPYPPGGVALAGARSANRGDRPGASPGPGQPIRYVPACDPDGRQLVSRADMQVRLVRFEAVGVPALTNRARSGPEIGLRQSPISQHQTPATC
jgi:hypothetical protein